jgi:hypothetical protein
MKTERERQQNKEYMRRWRAKNPELAKERDRKWKEDNLEVYREKSRVRHQRWRNNHLDFARTQQREKSRAYLQARRRATPDWLTKEHWKEIAEIYEKARLVTIETGVLHDVDHIWPLKSDTSCGLHVPWNLQVITHARNVAKGRRNPEDG